MSRFAVFDLETTGFSPERGHRIVEVGIVLVDDDGHVVYEWETLVNPQREVSASDVHGLTAADLHRAPSFDQIAGEVSGLLRGRVPVAHNLSFDSRFLAAEFARLGHRVPLSPTDGICTMRAASRYLESPSRTLSDCCNCIGYHTPASHAALHDARSAGQLLGYYISRDSDFLASWSQIITTAQTATWPEIPATEGARRSRSDAVATEEEHFLARLTRSASRSELHPEANSYLAVIDRILLDRRICLHEADELVELAGSLGISREDATRLHEVYLKNLAALASRDNVITDAERQDLLDVARLLGLADNSVDDTLENAPSTDVRLPLAQFTLESGDRVVFTGEAAGATRSDIEYQATSLGLKVTSAVSGKTKLVVAADPDSLSGKARKARDLEVPIVDYETYFEMISL